MSRATAIADLLVADINSQSFSQEFVSTREYRPIESIKALKNTLHVQVLIPQISQTILTRSATTDTITIDVLVQKKVDRTNDVVDQLMNLVEEISDYLRGIVYGNASWVSSVILVPYDPEDLSSVGVFTGLVRSQFNLSWVKN